MAAAFALLSNMASEAMLSHELHDWYSKCTEADKEAAAELMGWVDYQAAWGFADPEKLYRFVAI